MTAPGPCPECAKFREVARMWLDVFGPPDGLTAKQYQEKYGITTFADAMDAITETARSALADPDAPQKEPTDG